MTEFCGVGSQTTEIDVVVYMWGEKILRLLANTALYLGNGTSYYGGPTRSHRQSIEQ